MAFSRYHGNHFVNFLAHVLSWVKTYHHAKFRRNPPTGLAGMKVQTYRPTDKFCIFSDMPPGIKPSQDGGEDVLLREKWPKYHFWLFLITTVTILRKFLAHVLSWAKTYHHAKFQRNPLTDLAGMMVQTYRQTKKFCIFPDMPPGIKPSQGGSPPSLKVWSKTNRGILRNG